MEQFIPHGHCYLWRLEILIPYVLGHGLAFLAYAFLGVALLNLTRKDNIRYQVKQVCYLFGVFIFSCGLSHLAELVTIWYPIYDLSSFVALLTGVVSISTIIILMKNRKEIGDFISDR
jgi:hypothetical protein